MFLLIIFYDNICYATLTEDYLSDIKMYTNTALTYWVRTIDATAYYGTTNWFYYIHKYCGFVVGLLCSQCMCKGFKF